MTSAAPRLLLFGHPVAHSLSPAIQQAFATQCGMSVAYGLCDVQAAELAEAVRAFFAGGGHGANVTVPHKRAAFEMAAMASGAAQQAGAANVLWRDAQGRLCADNSDGSGLLADLRGRRGLKLAGMRVLLLGAGGAARGVARPLLQAGVASLVVANRTHARAAALAGSLGPGAQALEMPALGTAGVFDLVIHATSAGHAGVRPDLPGTLVAPHTACCDLSYGPAARPFLDWAREQGARSAFDGLGMLVETAAASFARWFGKSPRTEPVFEALA